MQELFSEDFSEQDVNNVFTIYQLSNNLYQAQNGAQIIILWKVNNRWEGVCNKDEGHMIESIGAAIDRYLQKATT
jgi:hypothetical protein